MVRSCFIAAQGELGSAIVAAWRIAQCTPENSKAFRAVFVGETLGMSRRTRGTLRCPALGDVRDVVPCTTWNNTRVPAPHTQTCRRSGRILGSRSAGLAADEWLRQLFDFVFPLGFLRQDDSGPGGQSRPLVPPSFGFQEPKGGGCS